MDRFLDGSVIHIHPPTPVQGVPYLTAYPCAEPRLVKFPLGTFRFHGSLNWAPGFEVATRKRQAFATDHSLAPTSSFRRLVPFDLEKPLGKRQVPVKIG